MSKSKAKTDVETADNIFSALAHPARRQILLSVHYRGSCKAKDIADRFECSWPTTSRHLAKLVDAGLLDVKKSGRERVYRANAKLLHKALKTWSNYFDLTSS